MDWLEYLYYEGGSDLLSICIMTMVHEDKDIRILAWLTCHYLEPGTLSNNQFNIVSYVSSTGDVHNKAILWPQDLLCSHKKDSIEYQSINSANPVQYVERILPWVSQTLPCSELVEGDIVPHRIASFPDLATDGGAEAEGSLAGRRGGGWSGSRVILIFQITSYNFLPLVFWFHLSFCSQKCFCF